MKGRALAKNEVKHDIFDHLSVVQIFLAGSFVAIRLTAAYSNSQRSLTVRRAQIGPFPSFLFPNIEKKKVTLMWVTLDSR